MNETPSQPDRRTVVAGKAIAALVAHAPWAWPVFSRRVTGFFDQASSGWDERSGAGSVEHLAALSAAVLDVAAEPERILDVGCGTGETTLFLAREFPRARVRGLDISASMVRKARSKIGLDPEARVAFRQGDASKLPWPENSFDLVTMVNMPIFFREIARVLRPGGSVIVVATLGDDTPFSTPAKTIERGFAKLGIESRAGGTVGRGTWVSAIKDDKGN